jgi:UDP-N-acetylglucosamine 2-epimerase
MSDIFFRELGMPTPDRHFDVGSGSHAEQTAKIMVAFEKGDGHAAERIADILLRQG